MTDEFYRKLFENPDLFPLGYQDNELFLVDMDRESYHRSIFCDTRIIGSTGKRAKVNFLDVYNRFVSEHLPQQELVYIFHIAHCGSTLLSRAMDLRSENLVCREPFELRNLAVEYASKDFTYKGDGIWQKRLELLIGLLGRKYESHQPTIIKANVPVNFMIPPLMDASSGSKGIFLYHTLEDYLLSVLKSKDHQNWVSSITALIGHSADKVVGISAQQRATLSVPALAAYLWLAQIAIYNKMLNSYEDTCSLNAEEVYNHPKSTLQSAFEFVGQSVSPEKIGTIVEGELFSHYSKIPTVKFDNTMRLSMREEQRILLADELLEAREWLESVGGEQLIPTQLLRPLTGKNPPLM